MLRKQENCAILNIFIVYWNLRNVDSNTAESVHFPFQLSTEEETKWERSTIHTSCGADVYLKAGSSNYLYALFLSVDTDPIPVDPRIALS